MTSKKLPTVCIIGRTNVGKSTLFNAMVGSRQAVIKNTPGVTRDRCYETVTRFGAPFNLIDTGALVGEEDIELSRSVREQTEVAMRESDVLIVVFDGLHGLHPLDSEVVNLVRQIKKPVIWVANKCEKPSAAEVANELFALGIDEIVPISAAHRRGIKDIVNRISEYVGAGGGDYHEISLAEEETDEIEAQPEPDYTLKLAILGKPNVGKSSLVNRLLGEERMIVSPIAGTTRDSIKSIIKREGKLYEIVDTAGLRKKAGVKKESIERYSNIRSLKSLAQCDVALFVIDAAEGVPTEQDARVVGLAHEKGKALIILINKWDLIEKNAKMAEAYRDAVHEVFKFALYAPIIFVSALTGQRCPSILDKAREIYDTAGIRIKTSELNQILVSAFASRPPPSYHGQPLKLMYATQVGIHPPTMTVFVNYPERVTFGYHRYLKNIIREKYPFEGSDIRIFFKRKSQLNNERRAA